MYKWHDNLNDNDNCNSDIDNNINNDGSGNTNSKNDDDSNNDDNKESNNNENIIKNIFNWFKTLKILPVDDLDLIAGIYKSVSNIGSCSKENVGVL